VPTDEEEMLRTLGLASMAHLFEDIPPAVRIPGLDLPAGLPEAEVVRRTRSILRKNRSMEEMPTFLGAGVYDHFVPASVRAIVQRSEFYSSYTPYQSELSQGILQALWEYQSLIAELTGLDVANTSMYDGSTALGEAALMAVRITGKREIVIPRAIHWERKAVLRSYGTGAGLAVREVDYVPETGQIDLAKLRAAVGDATAAVYLENPNFFGVFEEAVDEVRQICPRILIVGANPIALAVTRAPGDYGADIVVGEGQPLGNGVNFGGPLLGIFACKEEHLRRMPGRVIGLTKDAHGRRAFCMTLQTREQHIRREKAMSNICTNETLLAIASATYLSVLGSNGLRRLAVENIRRAKSLASRIDAVPGYRAPIFRARHFNEFVARGKAPYRRVHDALLKAGVHGGLDLSRHFRELGNAALFATTEAHTDDDVARLIAVLKAVK